MRDNEQLCGLDNRVYEGRTWVPGVAEGELLWTDTGLSFWGGVDPQSGVVLDAHHPLEGKCLRDVVLALPGSRGSCTGSMVILELLLNGKAPRALVLAGRDDILMLGVLVAKAMFGRSIPVVSVSQEVFADLSSCRRVVIGSNSDVLSETCEDTASIFASNLHLSDVALTERDQRLLCGDEGTAIRIAMEIIVEMAKAGGARSLIDVQQAHIDGCIYTGPATLKFAQQLVEWGARVKVPTTLNSISVDRCGWRSMGVPAEMGAPSESLAQAYIDMGVQATYTCAPYFLQSAPKFGEQIAWAESNAVIYANSVLGARTAKYPDFLDIFIALTGRTAAADVHLTENRAARLLIDVTAPPVIDDSFWPLLGYYVGLCAGRDIPVIDGVGGLEPTAADLRAFGAAFATTSSAPMFHIAGVTPEASSVAAAMDGNEPSFVRKVSVTDLYQVWRGFNRTSARKIDFVALGNPHFSKEEIVRLARECDGRVKADDVGIMVTTNRGTLASSDIESAVTSLRSFGVQFVVDTCWCVIREPVIPSTARVIITNSGKYAHYGPGLVERNIRFGSLSQCVDAACTGSLNDKPPTWM
ncbi:aconitase family protein [Paraburkholderia sp. EG285A]|uniref:cis-3-hydroxy-L-proline dehydratase n=1 Tax=Paraburkholderia sp. EG285A TaxID=3237009 RepID=UPI0034D196E0